MTAPSARLPLAAAVLAVFLWSFAFPASRATLAWFAVEQVVLLRYLTACGFYLALFALGKFPLPARRDLPALAGLGLAGVTVYHLGFVYGMGRVAGGAASLVITAGPLCVALLARVFLAEKLPALAWAGIVTGAAGVGIIAGVQGADGDLPGYLALLVAIAGASVYFVFQKPLSPRYSPLALTAWTGLAGTVPLLVFLPGSVAALAAAPWPPVLWIIAMGILSSGLGFLLWFYALSKLRAGVVASCLFVQPVFVTGMSWAWLGEIPEAKTFAGGAVVLAGLAMILHHQLRPAARTGAPH